MKYRFSQIQRALLLLMLFVRPLLGAGTEDISDLGELDQSWIKVERYSELKMPIQDRIEQLSTLTKRFQDGEDTCSLTILKELNDAIMLDVGEEKVAPSPFKEELREAYLCLYVAAYLHQPQAIRGALQTSQKGWISQCAFEERYLHAYEVAMMPGHQGERDLFRANIAHTLHFKGLPQTLNKVPEEVFFVYNQSVLDRAHKRCFMDLLSQTARKTLYHATIKAAVSKQDAEPLKHLVLDTTNSPLNLIMLSRILWKQGKSPILREVWDMLRPYLSILTSLENVPRLAKKFAYAKALPQLHSSEKKLKGFAFDCLINSLTPEERGAALAQRIFKIRAELEL